MGIEIGYFSFPLIHPDSFPGRAPQVPGQWVQDGGLTACSLASADLRTRNLLLRIVHLLARAIFGPLERVAEVGFRPDHRGFPLFPGVGTVHPRDWLAR